MQLFLQGESIHTVEVTTSTTVSQLKHQFQSLEGISVCDQQITFAGLPLADEDTIENIPEKCTLFVSGKLLGGKVHGSLARAGKVKGQTPKVEAQEKKKKKTGRCKRRIQYNRRFSTAVNAFGRKKGPNSNSD